MTENSIRRTYSDVTVLKNEEDPNLFAVQLVVTVEGKYEGRDDALLMIADAWVQLMVEAGLDPDKLFAQMRKYGSLN